jgi:uncharacterized metal-binding protein YceD (DUF177 family)
MTELRSEFHRPIATHDLPLGGRSFDIEARPDERAALARRFEILAINHLRADGVIRPQASGRVKLEGHLSAEVVQTCVVTLEPVTAVIDVALERLYGLDVMERIESGFNEAFLDLADDLPAETLIDDVVDIGAAAAEQLGLELDLYPRKPGAVFEGLSGEGPKEPPGPLAQLADWRKRKNETG